MHRTPFSWRSFVKRIFWVLAAVGVGVGSLAVQLENIDWSNLWNKNRPAWAKGKSLLGLALVFSIVATSGCAVVRQTYNAETGVYTSMGWAIVKGDVGDLQTSLDSTKLDDGSYEASVNQHSENAGTDITPLLAEIAKLALTEGVPVP